MLECVFSESGCLGWLCVNVVCCMYVLCRMYVVCVLRTLQLSLGMGPSLVQLDDVLPHLLLASLHLVALQRLALLETDKERQREEGERVRGGGEGYWVINMRRGWGKGGDSIHLQ